MNICCSLDIWYVWTNYKNAYFQYLIEICAITKAKIMINELHFVMLHIMVKLMLSNT